MSAEEILLQRRGSLTTKAYIKGRNLVIVSETEDGGKFTGILIHVDNTFIKRLMALTEKLNEKLASS